MSGNACLARRIAGGALAIGCLAWPGAAAAKLPSPKSTLIVPGVSIGGVKLGMNQSQVFHEWGHTGCIPGLCTWTGPGNAAHAESATVSFFHGSVIKVAINAGTTNGTDEKFKPGELSKWKTGKNIGLGSLKSAVKRAYPAAKANNSDAVHGYDLFNGKVLTRFGSFGVGATPDRLRGIELS